MTMFGLLVGLTFGVCAHAGVFGIGEPPKDFLALQVTAVSSSREYVTFTIQEFVDLLRSDANKISWEKSSDSIWDLKVKHKDKLTGATSNLGWEFAKVDNKAVLHRMSADDVVLNTEYEIMNGFQSYAAIIEAAHAKAGVGKVKQSANQSGNPSVVEIPSTPNQKDELGNPTGFTAKDVVNYFSKNGYKVTWTSVALPLEPHYQLLSAKGPKSVEAKFFTSGCMAPTMTECLEIRKATGMSPKEIIKNVGEWYKSSAKK